MKSIDIKKLFAKIRAPKRKEFRTISAKARHDWKFILVFSFASSLLFVAMNMYLFLKINKGEIFVKAPGGGSDEEVISEKSLEDAVNFFEDRRIHFERLQVEKPTVIDPSL